MSSLVLELPLGLSLTPFSGSRSAPSRRRRCSRRSGRAGPAACTDGAATRERPPRKMPSGVLAMEKWIIAERRVCASLERRARCRAQEKNANFLRRATFCNSAVHSNSHNWSSSHCVVLLNSLLLVASVS